MLGIVVAAKERRLKSSRCRDGLLKSLGEITVLIMFMFVSKFVPELVKYNFSQEESYTSGCSALDLEPITKKSYDKSRRIVRGLFVSSYGLINSDINGSLNILRKSEKCIPDLVFTMRDKGKWTHPSRIRVAC